MAYKVFGVEPATSADINTYLMRQMMIVCTSGTRPASPQSGMRIWETDTTTERVWDGSTWALLNEKTVVALKLNNESVNNSTTLQNDDELFVPLEANYTYIFNMQIGFQCQPSTNTVDAKVGFTVPSGATLSWSPQSPHTNQTYDGARISVNQFTSSGSAADVMVSEVGPTYLEMCGLVIMGGTPGNLQLQWAQTTASSTYTLVLSGASTVYPPTVYYRSFIRAERVA